MTRQANVRLVLLLATAAVLAVPATGFGQYQTQNSTGRLLDANNRLGSDGINDGRRVEGGVNADDIVYGNVTRGRQFRGNVSSTDARAFRGNISRPSDDLTRDAGMSAYQRGDSYNPGAPARYYGDQRGVRPPEDFARLQPGSTGAFQVNRPTFRIPGDIRMDATIPNPELGMTRPSQYMLPGIERTNPNTLGFLPDAIEYPGFESDSQDQSLMPTRDLLQRLNLDEQTVRRMREEYRRTGGEQEREQQQPRDPADLTMAPENPINDPLNTRMTSAVESDALGGSMQTEQSLQQRLVTASRQNTQYAALRDRLEQFRRRQNMTDEEANRVFMEEWNAAQKAEQERSARDPQPRTEDQPAQAQDQQPLPAQGEQEGDETDLTTDRRQRFSIKQSTQAEQRVEGILPPQPDLPIRIASFADGVAATGLKQLLADAEKAIHDGKYTQSLDYYDAAAAVAPDNSMVLMGRAIAELGAGYYARAQTHLEQVLQADPALLMARYDLKAFYGDDRLQYIVRDLKDLAQTETRQSRPLFLLAFIAFSTENEQRTLDYLKLAEQRGGSAEFYGQLREYWQLEKKAPADPAKLPQK